MALILVGVERVIQKGQIAGNVDTTSGNQREKTGKVPRIVKELPPKRADFSFGDLVYWHLFVYGTTPKGDPAAKIGRPWDLGGFCNLIGITQKTLRNWVGDKHLPDDTVDVEVELFGNNPIFDDWRLELQQALRTTRARKAREKMQGSAKIVGASNLPVSSEPSSDEPSSRGSADQNLPMRLGTDVVASNADESEQGDGAEDEIWYVPASWTGDPVDSSGDVAIPEPEILRATGTRRRIRRTPILVAGLAVLLGMYSWSRTSPTATGDAPVVRGPDKTQPPKKADEANDNAARDKAAQEEENRKDAERKRNAVNTQPKEIQPSEAEKRAEAQRQAELNATRNAADARQKEQEATARALNEKLKIPAQADDGDLCKQKLEGLAVPDFALKCDTLIPFGKLLGAVPVSQTASSLGDCASRCRKVAECVAFSFDAGAHLGSASCYLTGSTPGYNAAPNWIAGVRP